ncbi:glutamine and serine-rich protein 1-like [Xyrauchen texanus]|uniref:glutamine and serine-rich protein 1-like n=1 Tax=Xyrauchen texanus TaxID=154827 RepID=UPI0022429635|nr:glutamine and serine-rich protein 1-like [Xyrauchen texanus]
MERNYPSSSFTEPVTAAAQSAGWAYKPSLNYDSTHLDSELLQRQTFASSHQPPTFTTSHHLIGAFDPNQHSTSSSNTTESSVMNFLSSIESRGLQAGPAGSILLPPFRSPSWQTGANSSTELFLTGGLHLSGTNPTPSALSSYQHPIAFPTRSFTTTSALTLQDSTLSSSNGLLSPNDSLLQLKSTQSSVPTALAFDSLGVMALGAGLPPQSSTYRSAQESAPHLLQPQFSLLPTILGTSQQAPQPYGAPVFSGSIERALQRECSVIKHHQRPSSTQPVQEQLTGGAQHSLQGYLHDDSDVSYQQDPSPHTPVPCSPVAEPSHTVNGSMQQKTSQAALQQTQAYTTSVPSPVFSGSSGIKVKDGSSKMAQHTSESTDTHAQASSPGLQHQSYTFSALKQNSVIASQLQPYTSAHLLPGLVSVSASHAYVTSQSNLSQIQAFSSSLPEKLPSIYKTVSSFASQSGAETSVSQNLIYSSSQQQDFPTPGNREGYETQVQTHCMGSPSQSYSSSHSQGPATISFYTQGPASTCIPSQNFVSDQPLTPSPTFSPSHARTSSSTNPTQDYILMQSSSSKTDSALIQHNYLLSVPSSASPATHTQALPNDQSSVELKPAYGKSEQDEQMFLSSKEGSGELPIEDVQALQKGSIGSSPKTLTRNEIGEQNNDVYVLSKIEDRQNTQSVIRSNSRSEEQIIGITHLETTKEERMIPPRQLAQLVTSANTPTDPKSNPLLMHSTHAPLRADQLKQQTLLLKESSSQQQNHQNRISRVQQADHRQLSEDQTQFIRVPSAQVLLEPSHMIVLQQPVFTSGQNQPKQTMYMQSVPVQYLQMNSDTISLTVNGHHNHQVLNYAESTKQNPPKKDNFGQLNSHEAKQNFPLSSVCFPESMLLADERHILSNVDDILAATAAACGVTPQDFVKSTSSDGELSSVANATDSKCHFQTVENRLNSFPSQNMNISNSQTMTINGAQMSYPKEVFMPSNSHNQQNDSNNSAQERSENVANSHVKNNLLPKEHFVNSGNDSALNANGLSISNTISSEFQLAGQQYNPSGHVKTEKPSNNKAHPKGTEGIKTDNGPFEPPTGGLPKKRSKSKGLSKQTVEDENGLPKPQKKGSQAKRQNSYASDASSTPASEGCHDIYQQQERMRQKLREVEEKQPEVKTGFLGSFLDFLKSGPRQPLSSPPIRSPSRSRKPSVSKRPPHPLSILIPLKPPPPSTPLMSPDSHSLISTKRIDEDLQRNLETLPSFSSDEDDSVGKNRDLQKSITSALSSLDEPSDKKLKIDDNTKQVQASSMQPTNANPQEQLKAVQNMSAEELVKDVLPDKLAMQLTTVAIEGLTDEELSDSGGEGMYRERDEFVVKNEDIERLKITLKAGVEPPAIWKVQKALLQKFVPELRDGKRVFFATNSYLGYFGDAKYMYRRVHVKFLDTVNKREYVRVCSRKPRSKIMHSLRGFQTKALLAQRFTAVTVSDSPTQKTAQLKALSKPRPKQPKAKAEPPPKKRKKWKEEFTTSPSDSSPEAVSEDDEFTPPVPFAARFLNTRTMKETFKSFVELLISVVLDADVMNALERENDELLLPQMKRVDGMIRDNRRRLLPKLCMGQIFKNALDSFPELSVVNELKTDCETPVFKVRLSGRAYNRKTMKPSKSSSKLPLEYTVDQQTKKWFSLYHSLQHYKYHTYLMCVEEIELLKSRGKDLGQEQMVQTCMGNRVWVEGLFDRFGDLLTQVQQACV